MGSPHFTQVVTYTTILTSPLFFLLKCLYQVIKVYVFVGVSILPPTIFLLDFGTVTTVWEFCFCLSAILWHIFLQCHAKVVEYKRHEMAPQYQRPWFWNRVYWGSNKHNRTLTIGRSLQYLLSCIDYRYDVHFSLFIVGKYPIIAVICGFHIWT